jgi:S1-C subfamily serine protease
MKTSFRAFATAISLFSISNSFAWAQDFQVPLSKLPLSMEDHGIPLSGTTVEATANIHSDDLQEIAAFPTALVSKLANTNVSELSAQTRTAKDAQLYRALSPSVVLIATKDGLGSGSLLGTSGDVITNWHVVKGYSSVAVAFKPAVEGAEPKREDIKVGRVLKYDEIADLALVRASEVPPGRNPIRLGDGSEINIGADVHAIGHPTGEAWTYTKGVISQYRLGYEWEAKGGSGKHKADVIQTQTPINPGNSGGPLISDSGTLIGVNSFKAGGEGLNFAVSVDDVKRFMTRSGNRIARPSTSPPKAACEPKQVSSFRNKTNDATVIAYDMYCTGRTSGNYIIPDKQSDAILLTLDRNRDDRPDVIFFDFERRKKWDLSFWDEKFEGHWTLVGYHDDGTLKPSRFESYDTFQKRMARR